MAQCSGSVSPSVAISVVRDDHEYVEIWSLNANGGDLKSLSELRATPRSAKRVHTSSPPSIEECSKRPRYQAEADVQAFDCTSAQYVNLTRCLSCREGEPTTGRGSVSGKVTMDIGNRSQAGHFVESKLAQISIMLLDCLTFPHKRKE